MMADRTILATLQRELTAHKGDVNYCDWSPTDQTLATCSGDKTVRLWRAGDGTQLPPSPIAAHAYYVNACVFSPGGDLLATASSDNTVKLWTTANWTTIGSLVGHEEAVRHCSFSPDGNLLATGSADSTARVWEVASLRSIATLTRHDSTVTCCGFAPNGWLLASGGSSGDLILFDIFSKRAVAKLLGHDLGVNALKFVSSSSPEVVVLATAGNDNTVRMWSVTTETNVRVSQIREFTGHSSHVYSCCFSPDGTLLASASADKSLILWDVESGRALNTVGAHSRYVTHCSFSPDGKLLVTASNDRTVKVWSIHTPSQDMPLISLGSEEPKKASPQNSLISEASWKVEDVTRWAESLAQRLSGGQSAHEEDLCTAERLHSSLADVRAATQQGSKAPDDLVCPITHERFKDPVVASDGFTYERSAIMQWLGTGRRSSPVTNLPLPNTLLVPNRHLKTVLDRSRQSGIECGAEGDSQSGAGGGDEGDESGKAAVDGEQ